MTLDKQISWLRKQITMESKKTASMLELQNGVPAFADRYSAAWAVCASDLEHMANILATLEHLAAEQQAAMDIGDAP
jgi:hypothetical protein